MLVVDTDDTTPAVNNMHPDNTGEVCTIDNPSAGETSFVTLDENTLYDLRTDLSQVKSITMEETSLACTFNDDSKIIFENFTKSDTQNEIIEARAKFVTSMAIIDELIALMEKLETQNEEPSTITNHHTEYASASSELAFQLASIEPSDAGTMSTDQACEMNNPSGLEKDLAQITESINFIEPSSGEAGSSSGNSSSGYGFQSRADDALLNRLPAIGAIAPTALNYKAEFYQPRGYDGNSGAKTLAGDSPLTLTAQTADLHIKEDGQGVANFTASFQGGSGNGVMTLTVTGVNPSWAVSAQGWAHNADGSYSLTLPSGQTLYNGAFMFKPPADSDADMTGLKFTATVQDINGAAASETKDFSVLVDAVVDVPILTVPAEIQQAWYAHYRYYETPLNIASAVTDKDGSEKITKIVIDLSVPFTTPVAPYFTLADMGITLNKGIQTSPGIWEIPIYNGDASAMLSDLKLIVPGTLSYTAIHQSKTGPHYDSITVTSYVSETDTNGQEWDLSDNTTTIVKSINLKFVITPLVLDLDGNGIDLVSIDAGVHFDMNNNGTLDKTSWVGKQDALLALDINHDGLINNQSELFGNNDKATNGFENLAQYDSNNDGRIDMHDSIFKDLIVWRDTNQDGVSQAGEKLSLSDFNIVAINLNVRDVNIQQGDSIIMQDASFVYGDGSEGKIVDVGFNTQEALSQHYGANLKGTDLDDTIYGTDRNDVIEGAGGNDILYGGGGADDFVFKAISQGVDIIRDFKADEGDVLDFSNFFHQYDSTQQAIENFVFAREIDGGTVISVDASGSGNAQNAIDIVALQGVHGVNVQDMMQNGNLHIM